MIINIKSLYDRSQEEISDKIPGLPHEAEIEVR